MANRRGTPSHAKIYNYWLQLDIDKTDFPSAHLDFYDALCMTCGVCMDKVTNLERSHLQSHFVKQNQDVDNIILQCKLCHSVMPDFVTREAALVWVNEMAELYSHPVVIEHGEILHGPMSMRSAQRWVELNGEQEMCRIRRVQGYADTPNAVLAGITLQGKFYHEGEWVERDFDSLMGMQRHIMAVMVPE